jgi:hypothetical protein
MSMNIQPNVKQVHGLAERMKHWDAASDRDAVSDRDLVDAAVKALEHAIETDTRKAFRAKFNAGKLPDLEVGIMWLAMFHASHGDNGGHNFSSE